jgi:hypothetical protein
MSVLEGLCCLSDPASLHQGCRLRFRQKSGKVAPSDVYLPERPNR